MTSLMCLAGSAACRLRCLSYHPQGALRFPHMTLPGHAKRGEGGAGLPDAQSCEPQSITSATGPMTRQPKCEGSGKRNISS